MDEVIAATAYLDLFLRRITEPSLIQIFLKFLLTEKHDDTLVVSGQLTEVRSPGGVTTLDVLAMTESADYQFGQLGVRKERPEFKLLPSEYFHRQVYACCWFEQVNSDVLALVHSDRVLINLRKPGETGYKIPVGGGYRWVTAPNYLGEILEWTGWAILTWSTAGLSFAVFTMANLAPRAFSNHTWYRENFPDYPPERKALIPYLF